MTLQQLRYFLATCQHDSFAAAADSLYLAQPSLANQIRRLEGELGVELFIRSGRKLMLTEAARTLIPHAERVIAAVEEAVASVADIRQLRGGTAAIGTFGVAYHFFVHEVIADCAARYPDLKVRVLGHNTVEVCEMVREGELEVGLVALPINDSGLSVRPVMTDEQLFVSIDGPDLLDPMPLDRFVHARRINYAGHFRGRDPTVRKIQERVEQAGLKLESAEIAVESLEAALRLAARGLGTTVVLRTVTEEAGFPTVLRAVSFDPPLYETFAFIQRTGTKLSPATRELVRLTEQHIARFGNPAGNPAG